MIKVDSQEAKNQNPIIEFFEAVQTIAIDNVVDGERIFDPEFERFSKHLIIARKPEFGDEYMFVYCGTLNTETYGIDLTGRLFTEADFGEMASFFKSLDDTILEEKKVVYLSGEFDWQDREDRVCWYRVALPMTHEGQVRDVLSFCCYEKALPSFNSQT